MGLDMGAKLSDGNWLGPWVGSYTLHIIPGYLIQPTMHPSAQSSADTAAFELLPAQIYLAIHLCLASSVEIQTLYQMPSLIHR